MNGVTVRIERLQTDVCTRYRRQRNVTYTIHDEIRRKREQRLRLKRVPTTVRSPIGVLRPKFLRW